MPLLLVPFWCCCCCWEKAEGPLEVEEGAGACAACVIRCHAACSNSLDHGASSAPRVRAAAPLATRRISAVSSVVVVEVDVFSTRQQTAGLQLYERRRNQKELCCNIEIQLLHPRQLLQVRIDNGRKGYLMDVHFLAKYQVQKKIKWALVNRSCHIYCHAHRLVSAP